MLVKYGAVTVGYAIVGLPVFGPGSEEYIKNMGSDTSALMGDYIRNSSMLVNLSKAVGRLVVSYKEVQQLAGFTTLVYEMEEVLKDLSNNTYKRVMVAEGKRDKDEFD